MTGQVFLCFDRDESLAYADALARFLGDAGIPVWYDREAGGDQRWAQVVAQLQGCSAVIVVMTPGAERSAWVRGEIDFARQLGRPLLPLLLQGAPLAGLSDLPVEPVQSGAMPSAGFVNYLRTLLPYQPPYQPSVPPAPPRRTGLIVGIVAGAVVLLLCVAGAVVFGVTRYFEPEPPKTWQEQAASIEGVQNYLVSHPEWYEYDPSVGNHQSGRVTYPVDPPAGGVHNPRWQNCMGDVYPEEIPKEHAMHSLEHGAVWVTYRPGFPQDQVDRLAGRVRDVPFLFMSPYPGLDRPISLQAWGYQLKVDNADDKRIDAFIKALRINAAPEPAASCSNGVTDTGSEPVTIP